MTIQEKLTSLRNLMKKEGIDAYLIDNADHHGSEYVNDYYKERTYMTGFDGSNGKALITINDAFLWTDGRYFLQAESDLKNTTIKLMKMGTEGYPSLNEYLEQNLKGQTLGFDGECFTSSFALYARTIMNVKDDRDLVGEIWTDRGTLKFDKIWNLSLSLSGETLKAKLGRVQKEMNEAGATSHVLTSLDDVAWLFNLRGNDVDITPVFFGFAYLTRKEAVLFVNKPSLNEEAIRSLADNKVKVLDYHSFLPFLKELKGEKVLLNEATMNDAYVMAVKANNTIIDSPNPTLLMKAVKNKIQLKNNREVHIADGLAVFRFMKYLKENYGKIALDEFSLGEKVLEYRKRDPRFYEVSFGSIASWNEDGAIIHYEPTKESSKKVEGTGFFLLDSGGQYLGGTTDITRTFELGPISEEMKHHYTMVLRGFIEVSMAKFMKGSTGQNLDMLAREPFWKEGLDYKHGTGHGVGYMLNVHEGPQGIRYQRVIERNDSAPFLPGMITSIEPGLYLEGKYGIRIEDEILCREDVATAFGSFLSFETLTVAPIDLDPVIVKELTKDERKWLNDYHKFVYRKLSKICDKSELTYLKYVTRRV